MNIDLLGPKWIVTVTFVPVHIVSGLSDTIVIWDLALRRDMTKRSVKKIFCISVIFRLMKNQIYPPDK